MKNIAENKFASYPFTWFSIGLILGIALKITILFLPILLIIAIGIVLFCHNKFFLKLFSTGILIGALRMHLYTYNIWKTMPYGFAFAQKCNGTIIEEIGNPVEIDGQLVHKYELLLEHFIDLYNNIIDGNGWKIILYSEIPIHPGSKISAKITPIPFKKPIFLRTLSARYGTFFNHTLGRAIGSNIIVQPTLYSANRSIFNSIIYGTKVTKELQAKFDRSGLGYLLAVSGIHMSASFSLFYNIFRWHIYSVPSQKVASIFGLLGIFIYGYNVKKSWSMIRSTLMIILPIIVPIFIRKCKSHIVFVLTSILMLIIWPHAIADSGFQLSFSAVLALMLSKRGIIEASLSTFIATAPYTIYTCGFIAPISIISTVVIGPLFSFIIIPLAILSYLLDCMTVFDQIANIMIQIVDFFCIGPVIRLPLTINSIILWTAGLIGFALTENWLFLGICSILTYLLCSYIPTNAIIISKNRSDIGFIENRTFYTDTSNENFIDECVNRFAINKVIKSAKTFTKLRGYQYGIYRLYLNSNKRFIEATENKEVILTQFDLVRYGQPVLIDVLNNKIIRL